MNHSTTNIDQLAVHLHLCTSLHCTCSSPLHLHSDYGAVITHAAVLPDVVERTSLSLHSIIDLVRDLTRLLSIPPTHTLLLPSPAMTTVLKVPVLPTSLTNFADDRKRRLSKGSRGGSFLGDKSTSSQPHPPLPPLPPFTPFSPLTFPLSLQFSRTTIKPNSSVSNAKKPSLVVSPPPPLLPLASSTSLSSSLSTRSVSS